MQVWFEGALGIVSIGRLLKGQPGSYAHNQIACERTGKTFRDRPTWENRDQYEQLKKRGNLIRDRKDMLVHAERAAKRRKGNHASS